LNQAWFIDQKGAAYYKQPFADGVKFQIRSNMGNSRSLFWHSHIGGNQYILRIQDHQPFNQKQWWIFDRRTKTIRPTSRRNYSISNRQGKGFKIKEYAVIRQYIKESYQRLSFFPGSRRNLRNPSGKCLDVYGGSDTNNRHVIFYFCHNGANQGWNLDKKGVYFPRYPLKDGRKFQIKTIMKSKRALFFAEHIGSHQYRLRIQNNNPYDVKQWFIFDWRTRTIRPSSNRNFAVSVQIGGNNPKYNGYAAVVRKWKSSMLQKTRWFNGSRRNIRDVVGRCLDVHGNSDTHRRHVHWYKCHNGLNQGWSTDTKGASYPRFPIKSGVRFQIKSRMAYNKALWMS
jgi:hypothetical protein